MRYMIWYHLYNLSLQLYSKSNTPSWVFLTFFKLYKWYHITQSITYNMTVINYLSNNKNKIYTRFRLFPKRLPLEFSMMIKF